uniref:Cytochrome b-245 light chain n=1 Tax=Biomphalaria glabrata TaxID=6526 RepID=A0A9I3VUP1_BIOGL
MGKIEWAMWANEQAIVSCFVTILCGVLAVSGQFNLWGIGVYAILKGIVTFLIEYPRGKRQKGTSYPRRFQHPLSILISKGRLLTRNYFVRFVFYLCVSVPCCFMLPTILGALCYMITSLIYLVAAIKGEQWQPIEVDKEETGPKVIEQPRRPPPRRPDVSQRGPQENNSNQV